MKDAFLAITSWENNQLKMLGGFRFNGSAEEAEKVIGQWRVRVQQSAPEVKRETLTYEKHSIDVVSHDAVTVATVYDGDWFFAANDLPALKTLLDRADGRLKDAATTLATDENFTAAFKHMPASYAAFAYGRLDRYFARLAKELPEDEAQASRSRFCDKYVASLARPVLRTARSGTSFCGACRRRKTRVTWAVRRSHSLPLSPFSTWRVSSICRNQMPDAQKAAANGFPAAMQG